MRGFLPAFALWATGCSHNEEAPAAATVDVNAAAAQAQSDVDNYLAARRVSHRRVGAAPLAMDPVAAVVHYAALLDGGRYGEARRMWQGDGRASGLGERGFAKRYARLSRVRIEANRAAVRVRDGIMVVPVVLRGTLASGRGVAIPGTVSLRRDAAGFWRIAAATV